MRLAPLRSSLLATLGLLLPACGEDPEAAPSPADFDELRGIAAGEVPTTPEDGLVDPENTRGPMPGLWRESRRDAWEEEAERLETLGYLQGYKRRSQKENVTLHDRERACDGLNLYTSGHAPEALLMDMDGEVLHRWRCNFTSALPEYRLRRDRLVDGQHFWRRAHLEPDGGLLAIFDGFALISLDARSRVRWTYEQRAHHDLEVQPDGSIYLLTRKARALPRFGVDSPVVEDFVVVLDAQGNERRKVSVLECFEGSEYEFLLDQRCRGQRDPFHTNTLEVLDGRAAHRHPAFAAGNILVSCRNFDTVAVLDLDARDVPWASHEGWVRQHQPTVLDGGNLLLFDNLGHDGAHGRSRVVEFRPEDGAIVWNYVGTAADPFQSDTCGSCQRLANGNTLITESESGRAFEVDPEGELVWEFVNPHRAGPERELIANLPEVLRLPPDTPLGWLPAPEDEGR